MRILQLGLIIIAVLAATPTLFAMTKNVASLEELNEAIGNAHPGERIVVADGQ
jgi:hypothetical protein